MDRRIGSPRLNDDPVARQLIELLDEICASQNVVEPIVYYDFPLFRDEENNLYRSKVLLVSRSHGLFIFTCASEQSDPEQLKAYDEQLTQLDAIIYSKLIRSKLLRNNKRDLAFPVNSVLYAPSDAPFSGRNDLENDYATETVLNSKIEAAHGELVTEYQWQELISLVEGSKALARPAERDISAEDSSSRAVVLAKIEERIANFDQDQRRAAIQVVNGPQRIRGLAGSGKTIVLAMKVAHLHLDNPNAKILFTFWTKSLYELIRYQVTRFYRQFNDKDPDWDNLHILHAWGGRINEGVYSNACLDSGIKPLTLKDVIVKRGESKFGAICNSLISRTSIQQKYDYVVIDEGQDLPASFYKLCFRLCKGGNKDRNIIWAYDELQTIMDAEAQKATETFGTLADGTPLIDLNRAEQTLSRGLMPHDIILKRSYRNPPEVLMSAHALGMGVYSRNPVQMLEDSEHWDALGYKVITGNCQPGEYTEIERPKENSPLNLAEYVDRNEIIKWSEHKDFKSELDWVVNDIFWFLKQGLKPEDILIICLDDRNTRAYFTGLSESLIKNKIGVNSLQDTPYTIPKFFIEDHVSISTVYKAKGNEAAVVYVVGVDSIAPFLKDIRSRNRLFTAFTRSRAWLRISGMINAGYVLQELEQALENFPLLKFHYPDPEEIRTIQRDLPEQSAKIRQIQQDLFELRQMGEIDGDELIQILKGTSKKG